jgi:hypothetical protein
MIVELLEFYLLNREYLEKEVPELGPLLLKWSGNA